jgi:hypothetical protein
MDYFLLFFNDEPLNNIVIETNRYARHKISELQLSPRSICSRWFDVLVPEVRQTGTRDTKFQNFSSAQGPFVVGGLMY